jgi:AcrR family transcriptional regulator
VTVPSFQRAREPEQKEQRRQALLQAAASLLSEAGLEAVTLSAIAREAGLAKSNVYRYFESREQILLELLVEDEQAWVGELEHALAPLAGGDDLDAVAAAVASTLSRRTVMCELVSVLANVLEHNLSADAVAHFKGRVLELSIRIRNALHASLPSLPHHHTEALLRYLHALVAGLWPMAHPSPPVVDVLARPELRGLCSEFEPDLRGALAAMLRGLVRPPVTGPRRSRTRRGG